MKPGVDCDNWSGPSVIPTMDQAVLSGHVGMIQVAHSAGSSWIDYAERFITDYARIHAEVFGDDIWRAGLEEPKDRRAVGVVFKNLSRKGVLRMTNRSRPSAQAHGSRRPVWESLVCMVSS